MKKSVLIIMFFIVSSVVKAQEKPVSCTLCNGFLVGGYVDNGAFLNFTGPNVTISRQKSKFIIGMLPSLRMKEDKGVTKNSLIFPTLGVGLTYTYKMFAVQIPLYYNSKTSSQNGQWNVGFGIGFKLTDCKLKKDK